MPGVSLIRRLRRRLWRTGRSGPSSNGKPGAPHAVVAVPPLFWPEWYLRTYPDVAASGVAPYPHFLAHGARERRDPNPLFHSAWYERRVPGGAAVGNLLEHYLQHGAARGISPHPLFDVEYYVALLDGADAEDAAANALAHYAEHGAARGLSPHPLFDAGWYAAANPDVAANGIVPLLHYLEDGARELRTPHPLFNVEYYLAQLPDPAPAAANPLVDYLVRGEALGFSPHPLYDGEWYQCVNPSAAGDGVSPFLHFVRVGDRRGDAPHPLFDPSYYLRNNPDVAASGVGALRHYVEHGGAEGRNPHPLFDSEYYAWLHPEVRERGLNPLVHYLMQPREGRRHPHPLFDAAYQACTSALVRSTGIDPLRDYAEFRASLDQDLVMRHATSIPVPRRALLPARRAPLEALERTPLVSVLLPVYDSRQEYLLEAVDSVRAQSYGAWELIVVDDGSSAPHVPGLLERVAALDDRITVLRRAANGGIARATNDALRAASGEYVAMLDHDDVLMRDALAEMVAALVRTSADAAYSDQVYVSGANRYESAFHKPDWSPVLFSGVMYVGHLLVVRRRTALAVGGFDETFDPVSDFEFMLRVGEHTGAIVHVPKILYAWRKIPGSVALDANSKGPIEPVQAAAVNAHFRRTGIPARAVPYPDLSHRLFIVPRERRSYPAIDVVVRGDRPRKLVETMLAELAAHPAQLAGRAVVAGSRSAQRRRSRIVSAVARRVAEGSGPFVLFVDPAVRCEAANWLDYLLLYAERDGVAFVAPNLYRANGLTAAAGLVATAAGLVPAMPGWRAGDDGYAGSLACDREVSALAPGLLMVRRDVLAQIGGLSTRFVTPYGAFGDAALRARDAGLRNVAIASRIASVPDDYDVAEADAVIDALLLTDAGELADPYYNANFAPTADYAVAVEAGR